MSGSGSQTRHGVMIGRNLAHYEVLEELGRGGMGVVYKARDTRLDRLVALKLLPEELAGDRQRVELLRREAQASAALNHPRIVTIYSVEEADGQLFLTMEHVEGKTLDRAIPKHGLDLERFFKIAIPLADAVATAHDQKIVHRDLKPGNIVLSSDDRPKILDFGLARLRPGEPLPSSDGGDPAGERPATQLETLDGKVAGTPAYMAPEQLTGGPVDHRTDLFSLGIIYYEMATGRHPFRRREGSPISTITGENPDSVSEVRTDLPRQLVRIIHRCLEKDPERRMQSAKDLRNELEEVRRELSEPATSPTRRGRLRRWALPALVVALAAAAAGLLVRERLDGGGEPRPPIYLTIEETRLFPGDRGPEYFRRGVIETLGRRLGRLGGLYLATGDGQPLPDYVVEADVRLAGEHFDLTYRLRGREPGKFASAVHNGTTNELFPLIDGVARELTRALDGLGRPVRYRRSRAPTDDPEAFDLFLQAAALREERGGSATDEAMRLLEKALRRDPGFALALSLSGRMQLDLGRASAAEAACRQAASLDATLPDARSCLGDVLSGQGRAAEAVDHYRAAMVLDPRDLSPQQALKELGRPESLEPVWRDVIRAHPDHWVGFAALAEHYSSRGRYGEAAEQYREALARAPAHPRLHARLGGVFIQLGELEKAHLSNEKSMGLRANWDAAYNLGALNYTFKRYPDAIEAYRRGVKLRPDDYRGHGRLGWTLYVAFGDLEQAEPHLRRAVDLAEEERAQNPETDSHAMVAVFEALLGNRERSIGALERARYYQPNDGHALFLAAVAHTHLGDHGTAVDRLEEAVAGGYPKAEIRTFPDLEQLGDEARFQALLTGLPGTGNK